MILNSMDQRPPIDKHTNQITLLELSPDHHVSEFDIRHPSATQNPPSKHHAANAPVPSSMQRLRFPRRTILTIDFINFSHASVPGWPSLILTTGTSIIVMACKNEELTSTWQPKADIFPRQEGLTTCQNRDENFKQMSSGLQEEVLLC